MREAGFAVTHVAPCADPAADAAATLEAMPSGHPAHPCWLAADGYRFPLVFQQAVKAAGHRLLVMDDNAENRRYASDLVLNQNIDAREDAYRDRMPGTQLMLGTRYALLRPEFLTPCTVRPPRPGAGQPQGGDAAQRGALADERARR